MAVVDVRCPDCDGLNVVKYGKQPNGTQRFICQNTACQRRVFLLNYQSRPSTLKARQQIIDMALRGMGVDEVAQLLRIPPETVMEVFQHLSRFALPPTPRPKKIRPVSHQVMAG